MFNGDFSGGLWIAFIGWFLDNAASQQVHQVMFQGLLAGHTVSQAMSSHCVTVPADLTIEQLVDEHIFGGGAALLPGHSRRRHRWHDHSPPDQGGAAA